MSKESILGRCRQNITKEYDMPRLDDIEVLTFEDPYAAFVETSKNMGCNVVEAKPGQSIDSIVKEIYPEAKVITTNIEGVRATHNPDEEKNPQNLNGTDVGIIKGELGVAENGCIWVPQTMENKAVCFISENLVILLDCKNVVSNMHEAYKKIKFNDKGYGTFISGPSKTADIAQVLVMGAQAARGVTLVMLP